ncbi:MAG: hypothetical protein ACTSRG_20680 [Candidatus Helarchaeota archaeon]
MPKCPRCGEDILEHIREWTYNGFRVKRYDCKTCKKSFKAYFHKGKLSHILS